MSYDLTRLGAGAKPKSSLVASIENKVGSQLGIETGSKLTAGIEAFAAPTEDNFAARETFAQGLSASAESIAEMFPDQELSTAQKVAGALILQAGKGGGAGISEYLSRQYAISTESVSRNVDKNTSISVESMPGSYDYRTGLTPEHVAHLVNSAESFDNRTNTTMLAMSINYSVQAAKQSPFSEAFFPTSVIAPDVLGATLTIPLRFVLGRITHETTGEPVRFNERRLIEATVDHTILRDDATILLPEVHEDGKNADFFLPAAQFVPETLDLANRTITTAPIKYGKSFDIIGNGSHTASQNNGIPTRTDTLDPGSLGVKELVFTMGADTLRFNVRELFGSKFFHPAQGHGKDMILAFKPTVQLNKNTLRQYNGEDVTNTTLKTMLDAGWIVNVRVTINGEANVETGTIRLDSHEPEFVEFINPNGLRVSATEDPAAKAIYNALVADFKSAAAYPDARLTNSNFRHTGKETNTRYFTERYPVQLGSPVTCPFPHGEDRGDEDMKTLIAMVRMRNDNNALTKLLDVEQTLSQYEQDYLYRDQMATVADIEGIARFLIQRPISVRKTLHLPDLVRNVKTSEVMRDLRAQISNVIGDTMIRLGRAAGIHQAVQHLTGYADDKINVILGTDQVLENYLWREGDTRVISENMTCTVVSTPDARMYNKVIAVFSRGVEGADAMNFGTHYWTPEFMSILPVARDNSQHKEMQVMPRNRHVVNIPVMATFDITGLEEVLVQAGIQPVAIQSVPDDLLGVIADNKPLPPTGP